MLARSQAERLDEAAGQRQSTGVVELAEQRCHRILPVGGGAARLDLREASAHRCTARRPTLVASGAIAGRLPLPLRAMRHSLHRGVGNAKGFYAIYAGLVAVAAAIVLLPGSPLGLLTEGVQVLAGVLLPSASVFLLLCNDREVLGPWVNDPGG